MVKNAGALWLGSERVPTPPPGSITARMVQNICAKRAEAEDSGSGSSPESSPCKTPCRVPAKRVGYPRSGWISVVKNPNGVKKPRRRGRTFWIVDGWMAEGSPDAPPPPPDNLIRYRDVVPEYLDDK